MKKITAVILALLTALNITAAVSASDITGHKNESAIELLSALDLMDGYPDGTYRPDASITRAEFAALALRLAGMGDAASGYKSSKKTFTDVTEDMWYCGYTYMANDFGYMTGFDDGRFGGEENVTNNQAIKTIVCVLGYEKTAEAMGGYPQGYISAADNIGMLDNVSVGEVAATRGAVAQIIANALYSPAAEISYSSTGSTVWEGDKLMLEKLGYEQYRGVLESANGITSGGTAYGDNGITISGIAYENKFGDVSKYFGLEIEFLVKKDTNEVYYVRARGNYNSLTVEAEDINANTSLTEFCYDVNGKEKKQDLENITIIYNGKPLVSADVNADALKPGDGRVILIDSDGNDKYETALVWEYRNIMVNNVYDDVVYGRYSESANLSAEKSSKSVSLTYNSETVTVDEIKQGDILSVFESKDGSYIRAIISRDTYNGVIKTERKGKSVTLSDGKELKYSKTYNDLISGTSPTLTPPSFGDQVTFYTDAYGKIAFYVRDAQSRERSYGYLTNVLCDNWSYQDACVEYLDENNTICKLYIEHGDKVKIGCKNGSSYEIKKGTAKDIYNAAYDSEKGKFESQLIKYSVSDGKLTEIYFTDTTNTSGVWDKNVVSAMSRTYSGNLIGGDYILHYDIPAFYVPSNGDTAEFKSGTVASFMSSGSSYNTKLYDIKDGQVGCVVIMPTVAATYGYNYIVDTVNSDIMLITDSGTALADDGVTVEKYITGYVEGELTTVNVSDELEKNSENASMLKPGVVIQYVMNTDERSKAETADEPLHLILFNVITDFNESVEDKALWNKSPRELQNVAMRTLCGTVTYADSPNVIVSVNGREYPLVVNDYARVLKYDIDSCTGQAMPKEAVCEGMRVFVRQRYNVVREVYIID